MKSLKKPLVAAISMLLASTAAHATDELNALVWCDHTDPALLKPFEKAHNVKVNVKEYEGTAAGFTLLQQSRPGDWDVMVIDAVDVKQAVKRDFLAPLPDGTAPTQDYFPQVVLKNNVSVNGKTYAAVEKFGYNTISYNKAKVDEKDMQSMDALWSGKYKGRIAMYDYYLPVMGLVGLHSGIDTKDLNTANLEKIRKPLMALRAQSKQVSSVVASQTALATGEADILIGGGEWLTAVLHKENPNLTWTIPKEGGLLWAQSLAIVKGSQHKKLAAEFIKYITSPQGQARLATSSCYWGMPANKKAGSYMSNEQKSILRWNNQPLYLNLAHLYPIPDAKTDAAMQDMWTDMLQSGGN